MQKLKKDLRSTRSDLKKLTKKTEIMLRKVERFEKKLSVKKSGKKPKVKANKKPAKKMMRKKSARVTATDTVLSIIARRKRGIDTATIKMRTGFDERKIWNIINNLKREGKVKSKKNGVYLKA